MSSLDATKRCLVSNTSNLAVLKLFMSPGNIPRQSFESAAEDKTEEEQKSISISSVDTNNFELTIKTRNTAEVKSDDFLQVDHENSKTESSSNFGLETLAPLAYTHGAANVSNDDFERIEVIG